MSTRKHPGGRPPGPPWRKVTPAIDERAFEFYSSTFSTPNAGVTWALEAFPTLYRSTLDALRGRFARGELLLMLDAMNGLILTPEIAGQHVALEIHDAIELQGLDEKWRVDAAALRAQLSGLALFERACIEVWVSSCWRDPQASEDTWLAPLIPVPLGDAERELLERAAEAEARSHAARAANEEAEAHWRRTRTEAERAFEDPPYLAVPPPYIETDAVADFAAAERLVALGLVRAGLVGEPGTARKLAVELTDAGRRRVAWEREDDEWEKAMGRG
jgi:hypothetical protein